MEDINAKCSKCGSDDITYNVEPKKPKKKRTILWWLVIGWWWWLIDLGLWLFTKLPIIIANIIQKNNNSDSINTIAVCQNCGNSWKVKRFDKKTSRIITIVRIAFILLILLYCLISNLVSSIKGNRIPPENTIDPNLAYTTVAQTVVFSMTQTRASEVTSTPTALPTETPTPKPTLAPEFIQATEVQATIDYKSMFSEIDYRELVNYTDNHIGEFVKVTGQVFNIIDNQNLQAYFKGTYDAFYVSTESAFSGLYEDDNIVVFGIVYGNFCGTNAFGAEICQPALINALVEKF